VQEVAHAGVDVDLRLFTDRVSALNASLWGLLLSSLAVLALVMVNGAFVAAEFAIVRVRRTRMEELAGEGKAAAKRAIQLIDAVTEYLAVTQIGSPCR